MRLEQLAPPLAISPACEARTRPYVGSSEASMDALLPVCCRYPTRPQDIQRDFFFTREGGARPEEYDGLFDGP